ncbi:MAG TPA: hypothetical protein VGF41_04155 [Myxococcaceae bacterium]
MEGRLQLGGVVLVAGAEVVTDRLLDRGAVRRGRGRGGGEDGRQPEGKE